MTLRATVYNILLPMTNVLQILVFAALTNLTAARANATDSFYVDYSTHPNPDHLLAYNLNVIHPSAEADLKTGQQLGNRYLAYLSVVEIAADAPYQKAAKSAGIVPLLKNAEWNSDVVDPSDPKWRAFVIESLARPAIEKGFDGFMLDTVDSIALISEHSPERADAARAGIISLIKELRTAFPDKEIVMNRGFKLLGELGKKTVDGILVESVFHTFDSKNHSNDPVEVDSATTRILESKIRTIKDAGLPVYVIDYLPKGANQSAIEAAESKIRDIGAAPFLSTPELNGTVIGGGQVARRILVLFGFDPEEAETHRIYPADTTSHALLQMPLEWMGYELVYHDVSKGIPTLDIDTHYAGVILDEELEFPFRKENEFADWLIDRIDDDKKVLFLGSYGFNDDSAKSRVFQKLGIPIKEEMPAPKGEPIIASLDAEIMNFEVTAFPTHRDFDNVTAPEKSRILLSLEIPETDEAESPRQKFDAAYLTSWGGALLTPFVVFEASEETILQHADPFAFLQEIWPAGKFPAPDPTTRDGLRVFYTHVDGDGFSSISSVHPGKTCADVLYNDFLKDMPWPITISVIESEIRGHMLAQKPTESAQLTQSARKIFQLPNVQTASHSYSHPYVWMDDDPEFEGLYDTLNLRLKLTAKYPSIDYSREILDSLSYITENLAPADKPANLMLWSGNCRPSAEVLKIARENGYETMNGGNTILCSRLPGLFGVAPRVAQVGDELQIYAANQNEYLYTDGWNGPTWGGFAQVTETFEMTESPRRLKPVNVYYHFYSVERPDAYAALKHIYDWCSKQNLHPTTTIDFARITRDSYQTRLVKTGSRNWVALNEGYLRTFRVPSSLGTPNIASSKGVTGFNKHDDMLFIHTNGDSRIELKFEDQPPAHPHIETASAEIEVTNISPTGIALKVQDYPATLIFSGFKNETNVQATVADETKTVRTDPNGRLTIKAPADALLSITQKL